MSYQIIGRYPLQKQGQSKPKREPRPVHIYVIRDPDTERVRYVGQAINPESRALSHGSGGSGNFDLYWYIRDLMAAGKTTSLDVIEIVPPEEANAAEARWVHHFHDAGEALFNKAYLASRRAEAWSKECAERRRGKENA